MPPPWKVEVAVVEARREPTRERREPGEVVPIPMLPFALMRKRVEVAEALLFVEDAISKSGVCEPFVFMIESFAHGVVVPKTVFTLYAPLPPSTREFDTAAWALAPMAMALVRLLGVTGPVTAPLVSSR
jgi:hypothetical protein